MAEEADDLFGLTIDKNFGDKERYLFEKKLDAITIMQSACTPAEEKYGFEIDRIVMVYREEGKEVPSGVMSFHYYYEENTENIEIDYFGATNPMAANALMMKIIRATKDLTRNAKISLLSVPSAVSFYKAWGFESITDERMGLVQMILPYSVLERIHELLGLRSKAKENANDFKNSPFNYWGVLSVKRDKKPLSEQRQGESK